MTGVAAWRRPRCECCVAGGAKHVRRDGVCLELSRVTKAKLTARQAHASYAKLNGLVVLK
jgi:hypothetical protein